MTTSSLPVKCLVRHDVANVIGYFPRKDLAVMFAKHYSYVVGGYAWVEEIPA